MKHRWIVVTGLLIAFGAGEAFAGRKTIDPQAYRGKPEQEAAKALLTEALVQADDGSWERIAVGRIYYLGGMKSEGQAIFDAVLSNDPDPSDLFRIARVYREAGEWSRAKPLFDQSIHEKGLAEVGGYYLLAGDRATAESMFERSFKLESELWATLSAAGAYLGVDTQD